MNAGLNTGGMGLGMPPLGMDGGADAANNPLLQMLAQRLNQALGGDPQKTAQALEQAKQLPMEQLMMLLALLDPEVLEALKQAMGGGQPQGGAPAGGAPAGGAPAGGAPRGGAPRGGAPAGAAPRGGAPRAPAEARPRQPAGTAPAGTRPGPASRDVTPNTPVTPGRNGVPAGLQPNAARGAALVRDLGFTGTIGGMRAPGGRPSDHHHGNAIDVMTHGDRAMGNKVKDYFIQNARELGVKYVIYEQRIYSAANNWQGRLMEDRGSPTQNHMDHPHISFN